MQFRLEKKYNIRQNVKEQKGKKFKSNTVDTEES